MVRRIGLGAGALALALGATVGTGVAGAVPVTVTLSGAVTCSVAGNYKFTPALTNSGGTPTVVSLKAKLTGCGGPGATSGGVTLTGGRLVATSATTIPNSFGAVASGSPIPNLTGTITWKGTGGHIVSSSVTLTGQAMSYDTGTNVVSIYAAPSLTGGSFATQPATETGLTANATGLTLSAAAKKGVKGIAFGKAVTATFAIGA